VIDHERAGGRFAGERQVGRTSSRTRSTSRWALPQAAAASRPATPPLGARPTPSRSCVADRGPSGLVARVRCAASKATCSVLVQALWHHFRGARSLPNWETPRSALPREELLADGRV
jgi:hypothetical protein